MTIVVAVRVGVAELTMVVAVRVEVTVLTIVVAVRVGVAELMTILVGVALATGVSVAVGSGVAETAGVLLGVKVGCAFWNRYRTASPLKGGLKLREAPPLTAAALVTWPLAVLNHSTFKEPVTDVRLTVKLPELGW